MSDNLDQAEDAYYDAVDSGRILPYHMKNEKTLEYHTKLAGVTFEGRQVTIATLSGDENVRVRREADNKYDPNAVAVDVMVGQEWLPIGYIAKDKNSDVSKALDANNPVAIYISSVTGGGESKSYGVNVHLEYNRAESEVTEPVKEEGPKKITKADIFQNFADIMTLVTSGGYELNISATKKNTVPYTSIFTGQHIDLIETNGHRGLPGYMSGSKFPEQFYAPFDKDGVLDALVKKFGVDRQSVELMWSLNGEASTSYGTAIHAAMENYDRNYVLGDKIKSVKTFKTKDPEVGPNKALSRNPFLKKIVEDFHEKFGGTYERFSEQFIWHEGKKLCGSIDRVKVIDLKKKIIRIQDFKTDGDIHEKKYQLTTSPFYAATQGTSATLGKELLDYHWFQLSFYAYILKQFGWTVEGLDVYWLNPTKLANGENAWEEFTHDVIDLEGVL